MKNIFSFTITEEDIRHDVEAAAEEMEEELIFPNDHARSDFVNDCVSTVIDKYKFYETYNPDYNAEVLDLAKVYGVIR